MPGTPEYTDGCPGCFGERYDHNAECKRRAAERAASSSAAPAATTAAAAAPTSTASAAAPRAEAGQAGPGPSTPDAGQGDELWDNYAKQLRTASQKMEISGLELEDRDDDEDAHEGDWPPHPHAFMHRVAYEEKQ